jgi:phosphate transport system substrate-binding protein
MLAKIVAALSAVAVGGLATLAVAANISGAGATFPAPIYSKWADTYHTQTGNQLNYQAIGSGGGIRQIEANTVDFGASDKPLTPDVLTQNGLQQFPTVIGGVVPVVNIPGVGPGQMKLTGPVLAEIFLGHITRWNDKAIAALNPGLKLPGLPITVVHRSDGSGTSFIFTTYLSTVSPGWKSQVGGNDSVNWPVGLGGKGNEGVATFAKQTPGSIGYVEYAYAMQTHAAYVLLRNKTGAWATPNAAAFAAAAAGADWKKAPGYYLLLIDQPGGKTWPISGATFILMHQKQANAQTGHDVLAFFDWCYKNGDQTAGDLNYVPLPAPVKALVRKSWKAIVGPNGKPVY